MNALARSHLLTLCLLSLSASLIGVRIAGRAMTVQYTAAYLYGGYTGLDAHIYQWFHQIPKQAPAIFALIMFALMGSINLGITIKTRAWFMLTIAFTAGLEVGGYACRIVMLHNPGYNPYVAMQALLIVSPIFLALVDYSATGKLMRMAHGGGRLHPGWVAKGFFASDILCLAIQGGGAGLSSSEKSGNQNIAKMLLIVGLVLQLIFFTIFTSITLYMNLNRKYGLRGVKAFRPIFICLYSTIALMYIRSIFRVVEFSGGWFGNVATHEAYFYCFDFLMIFFCFVIFTWYHFGFYLRKAQRELDANVPPVQQQADTVNPAFNVNDKASAVPVTSIQVQAV